MDKAVVYLTEEENLQLTRCWEYSQKDTIAPPDRMKLLVVALAQALEVAGVPIEIVPG